LGKYRSKDVELKSIAVFLLAKPPQPKRSSEADNGDIHSLIDISETYAL
jgi:hypothetical protein